MSDLQARNEKRIVYSCSGCADVGELADQVCRKLRKEGYAKTSGSCLAGIGAGFSSFIDAAKEVETVLTIDGCPVGCAKKIIENIGITPQTIFLTELGVVKGQTVVTTELVNQMTQSISEKL